MGLYDQAKVRKEAAKLAQQAGIERFITHECEVDPSGEEALADGVNGLYPSYVWATRLAGGFEVSKPAFMAALLVQVPGAVVLVRKMPRKDGRRRNLRIVRGVRLLSLV